LLPARALPSPRTHYRKRRRLRRTASGRYLPYNLRFPGQIYMPETGLNQNYFRDYDPAVGRYIESDPIGLWGGINAYAYARGSPLSRIDPSGLADYLDQCVGRYAACTVTQSRDAWTIGNWLRFQICKRAINQACARTRPTCCEEDDRHCRTMAADDTIATLKCAIANAKCLKGD